MRENIKRLIVEINTDLHSKIKVRSYEEGKTIKKKLIELIEAWLAN